ncbi:MAG: hypothetical protein ACK5JT_08100 [Hyphomicrobiaceae bacterium]
MSKSDGNDKRHDHDALWRDFPLHNLRGAMVCVAWCVRVTLDEALKLRGLVLKRATGKAWLRSRVVD